MFEEQGCRLCDAETLKKLHHRYVDTQIRGDAILQLDGHQRIQSKIGERLLDVQLRGRKPKHTSYLLGDIRPQQLGTLRRLRIQNRLCAFLPDALFAMGWQPLVDKLRE